LPGKQRGAWCEARCDERDNTAAGEEFATKPGASRDQDQEEKTRGMVRVQRSGGAPDRREERTKMEQSEHVAPLFAENKKY